MDIGARFQTPDEAARQATGNGVPAIGVSSQAAGAEDILIVRGGVIPPQDDAFLLAAGVSAIYGPGSNIPDAAHEILGLIEQRRAAA